MPKALASADCIQPQGIAVKSMPAAMGSAVCISPDERPLAEV